MRQPFSPRAIPTYGALPWYAALQILSLEAGTCSFFNVVMVAVVLQSALEPLWVFIVTGAHWLIHIIRICIAWLLHENKLWPELCKQGSSTSVNPANIVPGLVPQPSQLFLAHRKKTRSFFLWSETKPCLGTQGLRLWLGCKGRVS